MANPYGITDQQYAEAKAAAQLRSKWDVGGKSGAYGAALDDIIRTKYANSSGSSGDSFGANTSSYNNSQSFSGLQGTERDQIKELLSTMIGGGTDAYKQAQAQRQESIAMMDKTLGDYSKQSAFADAGALMQQNLNKSMEANMPMIQRSMQNAGTSGGSMQALLSQKLASDAALGAGALGAEQAKAYGQISTSLLGQRGGMTTGEDQSLKPIAAIADLLKTSSSSGASASSFDPLRAQLQAGAGGASKGWSTYGPDPANDWLNTKGTLEDAFRRGTANPLDPANNFLYGVNGAR